jgi:hypothetical protein
VASDEIPIMMQVLNLGAMTFATVLMLGAYDYCPLENVGAGSSGRCGSGDSVSFSLTIYVMECFLAQGVYWLFAQFWGYGCGAGKPGSGFNLNITQIFIFIIVVSLLWFMIVPLGKNRFCGVPRMVHDQGRSPFQHNKDPDQFEEDFIR